MRTLKEVLKDGKLIVLGILLLMMIGYLLFMQKTETPVMPAKMPSASMTPIIHGPAPNKMTPLVGTTVPGSEPMAMGSTLAVSPAGRPVSTNPAGYVLGAPTEGPATPLPVPPTPAGQ